MSRFNDMFNCTEVDGPKSESISHWGIHGASSKEPTSYMYIECPIAKEVAIRVAERAKAGMDKYGVTMMRDDYTTAKTIDMAIEEALDLAVYLTRVKKDMENDL